MTITDEIGGARKKKDRLLHGVSLFRKKNNLQATSTYSLCPFLPFILSLFSLFRSSWWATTKPMAAWVKDARRQKPGETQTTGELTFEVEEGTKNKNADQPIRKIPASSTTNCPPPPHLNFSGNITYREKLNVHSGINFTAILPDTTRHHTQMNKRAN